MRTAHPGPSCTALQTPAAHVCSPDHCSSFRRLSAQGPEGRVEAARAPIAFHRRQPPLLRVVGLRRSSRFFGRRSEPRRLLLGARTEGGSCPAPRCGGFPRAGRAGDALGRRLSKGATGSARAQGDLGSRLRGGHSRLAALPERVCSAVTRKPPRLGGLLSAWPCDGGLAGYLA